MSEKTLQIPPKIQNFFIKINESITKAKNSEHLLFLISKLASDEFDADRASIFLRDEKTGHLQLVAGTGIPEEIIRSRPIAKKQNISYWVAENKKTLILNGPIKSDRRFKSQSKESISSSIIIPLIFENSVNGVFSISRTNPEKPDFTNEDLLFFRFLGDLVVISLQLLVVQEKKIHSEQLAAIGLATAELVHSLKNLLVGLFGAVELIDALIKQGEWNDVIENWSLLVDSIKNLSTIVNQVLSYSRMNAITKEKVELNEFIESLCNFIKPKCNISKINFLLECPDEKIYVWANKESLHNAIMNILDNAIRFMPDGGQLKISCELSQDYVSIKIADTGPGIPEENLDKIFEPFFTTDKKKGTGIGLALTKKIVESHGGSIKVESKLGSGATFTIELPVLKQ
ncbi:MAG: GAF domain-containing sensor histidine kinase [Candidatus Omnitrophica bacterium]|nr:GAF domain-containing sensor histidine kinase [Candidatus Omnitrophota bacterium]